MKTEEIVEVEALAFGNPAPTWADCEAFGKAAVESGWCGHTNWFDAALDYQYCVVRGVALNEWDGWEDVTVDATVAANEPLPGQMTLPAGEPAPALAGTDATPETAAAQPESESSTVADSPAAASASTLDVPAASESAPAALAPASSPVANAASSAAAAGDAAALDTPAPAAEPLATPEQRQQLIEAIRPFVDADDEGIVASLVQGLNLPSWEKLTAAQFQKQLARTQSMTQSAAAQ